MSNGNGSTPGSAITSIKQMLEAKMDTFAQVLPRHLTPDRLVKVALNCIFKTPALQKCSAASLYQSVISAAELGLEPGGALGHAYLVPFGTVCQLIIGYRGFIELARRSGQLAQIEAHVVRECDVFDVEFGLTPKMSHRPKLDGDAGKPVLVYMIARLKDGSSHVEVMTAADVEKIRLRSRSGQSGPWQTDWEEMAKKTVLRRGMKYLPMSSELARAIEHEDEEFIEGQVLASAVSTEAPAKGNEKAKAALAASNSFTPKPIIDVPEGVAEADAIAAAEAAEASV